MHNKFLTAANADSKLRELRDANRIAQRRQSLFSIAIGLIILALIYANNFAVQSRQ